MLNFLSVSLRNKVERWRTGGDIFLSQNRTWISWPLDAYSNNNQAYSSSLSLSFYLSSSNNTLISRLDQVMALWGYISANVRMPRLHTPGHDNSIRLLKIYVLLGRSSLLFWSPRVFDKFRLGITVVVDRTNVRSSDDSIRPI